MSRLWCRRWFSNDGTENEDDIDQLHGDNLNVSLILTRSSIGWSELSFQSCHISFGTSWWFLLSCVHLFSVGSSVVLSSPKSSSVLLSMDGFGKIPQVLGCTRWKVTFTVTLPSLQQARQKAKPAKLVSLVRKPPKSQRKSWSWHILCVWPWHWVPMSSNMKSCKIQTTLQVVCTSVRMTSMMFLSWRRNRFPWSSVPERCKVWTRWLITLLCRIHGCRSWRKQSRSHSCRPLRNPLRLHRPRRFRALKPLRVWALHLSVKKNRREMWSWSRSERLFLQNPHHTRSSQHQFRRLWGNWLRPSRFSLRTGFNSVLENRPSKHLLFHSMRNRGDACHSDARKYETGCEHTCADVNTHHSSTAFYSHSWLEKGWVSVAREMVERHMELDKQNLPLWCAGGALIGTREH